ASFSGFIHLPSRHFLRRVNRPGILARSRLGAASHPDHGSGSSSITFGGARPSTLPSWTHEDTSVHARGRDRILTVAVMRLHSLQVCLITRRQTWMFRRPSSSHTPTPVRSLVKGADYRRGEADNYGGR
ncbi:hypothetical protein M9458_039449, partial [Cirrhinus mrigala]